LFQGYLFLSTMTTRPFLPIQMGCEGLVWLDRPQGDVGRPVWRGSHKVRTPNPHKCSPLTAHHSHRPITDGNATSTAPAPTAVSLCSQGGIMGANDIIATTGARKQQQRQDDRDTNDQGQTTRTPAPLLPPLRATACRVDRGC
jgi:hypothetical protein